MTVGGNVCKTMDVLKSEILAIQIGWCACVVCIKDALFSRSYVRICMNVIYTYTRTNTHTHTRIHTRSKLHRKTVTTWMREIQIDGKLNLTKSGPRVNDEFELEIVARLKKAHLHASHQLGVPVNDSDSAFQKVLRMYPYQIIRDAAEEVRQLPAFRDVDMISTMQFSRGWVARLLERRTNLRCTDTVERQHETNTVLAGGFMCMLYNIYIYIYIYIYIL
jgi:hypothetical protein